MVGQADWDEVRVGLSSTLVALAGGNTPLGALMWTMLLYVAFAVGMIACLWFIVSSLDEGS
jgi:hypothetical protein